MKPRWECVQCGASNSYWQTPCKKCGITKLQHDKLIKANKEPVAEVPCSAGLGVCVCGGEVIIEHEGYRYFATCVECDKDGPACDTWEDACKGWDAMKTQNA
jgi:ribosomal protein L40E